MYEIKTLLTNMNKNEASITEREVGNVLSCHTKVTCMGRDLLLVNIQQCQRLSFNFQATSERPLMSNL